MARDKRPKRGVAKPAIAAADRPDDETEAVPAGSEIDEEEAAELEQGGVIEALPVVAVEEPGPDEATSTISSPKLPSRAELARHDPLAAYMQEIRRYALLSREEEHDLAVRYFETGDVKLAHQLVTANLRLVVKIAHEYRRAYRNLLDLVQEGNIGLMQAVRKYDPFRGVKLSSYAAWWIRAYILKFILNNWRLVKIGTTQAQRKLFFNLRREKEKLERLGFEPEHRLLAERMQVTEEEVAEMEYRLEAPEASLDAPVSRDADSTRTRLDTLAGARELRPDVHTENEEFRALLREKLQTFAQTLVGRDETLFRERWLSDEPTTLQAFGDRFGISRERARQLESRLLGRLRGYLEDELGSAVDIGKAGEE